MKDTNQVLTTGRKVCKGSVSHRYREATMRAALTVLRSGEVGVGDPGTGDRVLVGEDMVAGMKGASL